MVLEMILHEGRNREIRRMCEAVGLEVARLKRTQIGNVKMRNAQAGRMERFKRNRSKETFGQPVFKR